MHSGSLLVLEAGSASLRPCPQMWGESKLMPGVPDDQYLHLELSKILESPDSHNENVHLYGSLLQAGGDF